MGLVEAFGRRWYLRLLYCFWRASLACPELCANAFRHCLFTASIVLQRNSSIAWKDAIAFCRCELCAAIIIEEYKGEIEFYNST